MAGYINQLTIIANEMRMPGGPPDASGGTSKIQTSAKPLLSSQFDSRSVDYGVDGIPF